MIFRILIILAYLSLFPTFVLGKEGEVKYEDFRIYITDDVYITHVTMLDINRVDKLGYTLENKGEFVISINFEL